MKKIAIIPARGGSKRIPKKNIKKFMGEPVLKYAIKAAIKSDVFEKIIVSTDNQEIAETAKSLGAEVPFLRSKKNSDDHASTDDVLKEVLEFLSKSGEKFDLGCCIYPVNPFLNDKKIIEGLLKIKSDNLDCVFAAVKYSYPIQRSFRLSYDNKIRMINPENYYKRSQEFEETFHDAGQFYWFRINSFMREFKLWTEKTSIIELNENEAHDIDTESDWRIAEIKFQIQKNLNAR